MRTYHMMFFLMVAPSMVHPFFWSSEPPPPTGFFHNIKKSSYYNSVQRMLHNISTAGTQEVTHLVNYAQRHPMMVATCGGLMTVAYYTRSLHTTYHKLQDAHAWSVWHSSEPLDKALHYDPQYAAELLQAIQVRYLTVDTLADFMGPIRAFMQDVDAERKALQAYASYARLMHRIGLYCCVDLQLFAEIDVRIERLDVLRAYCLQWLSKAKLGQL